MSKLSSYEFIKMIQEGTLDVIEWLALQDEESIRERVYERVPEALDISVGSYEYDAIEPTNTEFAVVYFMLRNVILLAFPQHSFGKWLTLSAASHGIYRKNATYASGKLLITGAAGTIIPAGTKFSNVIPVGSSAAIKYYTSQEYAAVGDDGRAEVEVVSDEIGAAGNAQKGEITLNLSDIQNLTSISNVSAISNGADEEDDPSLLSRLLDRVRNPISGGNKNAYRQWAREIPGVDDAEVISLWDGPGTVKVLIIGKGGNPILDLVDKVKEYLDPSDHEGEGEGMAPVGSVVTVATTEIYQIRIDINGLEFEAGYSLANTRQPIINSIKEEVARVSIGGLVRIHYVEDAVRHVVGVKDFGSVLMNQSRDNIQMPVHLKPSVGEVYFDGN